MAASNQFAIFPWFSASHSGSHYLAYANLNPVENLRQPVFFIEYRIVVANEKG